MFDSVLYYPLSPRVCVAGNAEWEDAGKTRCRIFFKTPLEWAALLYAWVSRRAAATGDSTRGRDWSAPVGWLAVHSRRCGVVVVVLQLSVPVAVTLSS